ncbi:MAG: S8 family serine peptidase [Asgard group archaeon]|nr:S8 family serine peptidase [Asgard group archaeon]
MKIRSNILVLVMTLMLLLSTTYAVGKSNTKHNYLLSNYSSFTDIGWHLNQINITGAWDITVGSEDIVIAVIDSGIDWSHTQINNSWKNVDELPGDGIDDDANGYIDDTHGWDFTANDSEPGPEATDPIHWHATFITGIICAALDNIGVAGTAPNVTVMDIRVLDASNYQDTSLEGLGEAIKYAVDNGADVINLSLQYYAPSNLYLDDIQYAITNNVPVVSVTGNTWAGGIEYASYPGAYDEVISVGATNYFYQKADYSNFGLPWTEIMAPVGDVEPWIPSQIINSTYPPPYSPYGNAVGTSFAAPQVAAVIALMRTINSTMSVNDFRTILQTTAFDLDAPGVDPLTGYGLLNATAAVLEVYNRTYPLIIEYSRLRMTLFLGLVIITMVILPIITKRKKDRRF